VTPAEHVARVREHMRRCCPGSEAETSFLELVALIGRLQRSAEDTARTELPKDERPGR